MWRPILVCLYLAATALLGACEAGTRKGPDLPVYSAELPLTDTTFMTTRALIMSVAKDAASFTDATPELSQARGQRSVFITAEATDGSALIAENALRPEVMTVSIFGDRRAGFLMDFARRIEQIRARATLESHAPAPREGKEP